VISRINRTDSLFGTVTPENFALYAQGQGPLTTSGNEAGAFVRTRDDLDDPDVQIHCVPTLFFDEGLRPGDGHGISLAANPSCPLSRGLLRLVSPEPTAKPWFIHNYYAEQADMEAAKGALRAIFEILATEPLAERITEFALAPAGDSDAEFEEFSRLNTQTAYHPVGSCRMGTDDWRGRRPRAPGPRRRRTAGGRRVDLPVRSERQHERAGDRSGREGRRRDPRPPSARRGGHPAASGRRAAVTSGPALHVVEDPPAAGGCDRP